MKKFIALLLVAVMCFSLGIGGTVAYLTDRETETNVFTVGDVDIELNDEFKQGSKLLPGVVLDKNVSIKNVGTNDAWVFYTYVIPQEIDKENVVKVSFEDTTNWTAKQEVFEETIDNVIYNMHVVAYNKALEPNTETSVSLTSVALSSAIDSVDGVWATVVGGTVNKTGWPADKAPIVYVNAYAIQKEEFANVEAAIDAYTTQWKGLNAEYVAPILIESEDDLVALGGTKINGTYYLMADLDMTGKEMKSMEISGGAKVRFVGNGHTISGLTLGATGIHGMTGSGNEVAGLFDMTAPATTVSLTVEDLTVKNATVSCSGYAAALVGYNPNGGTVITMNNVDVIGANVTSDSVAALVGYTTGKVNLTDCDVMNLTLTGEAGRPDKVGAFVGTANTENCVVTLENCINATTYNDCGRVINGATKNEGGVTKAATASNNEQLNNALAKGETTIILGDGEYIIPDSAKGKTLTIIGNGNTVVAAQDDGAAEGDCDYSFDGSTVTFENVTITTETTYFPGYARMKGIYNNCTINGVWALYDNSEFNNCTFNVTGDVYNVWTWGAAKATFNNCTFNNDGKAILLYGTVDTKLTVDGCTFNDKGGLTDLKAAIEIGNDYGRSYELIVNNTTVNGYEINDKGIGTGTTLWANKNSMGTDKLNVVVDGVDVY